MRKGAVAINGDVELDAWRGIIENTVGAAVRPISMLIVRVI